MYRHGLSPLNTALCRPGTISNGTKTINNILEAVYPENTFSKIMLILYEVKTAYILYSRYIDLDIAAADISLQYSQEHLKKPQ